MIASVANGAVSMALTGGAGATKFAASKIASKSAATKTAEAVAEIPVENPNIDLGVREHLDKFAAIVKGVTWKNWGRENFKKQFLQVISDPAKKNTL